MGLIQCIIATDDFVTAWQNVHAAVANNSKILMFWCSDYDTVENIQRWWLGANYADIVGMEDYPPAETAFASVYGAFCDGFAARYNKNFCNGETGSFNGGTVEAKEAWVSQLSNVDLNRFPCYKSITWFEYLKASDDGSSEYDHRIIQGQLPAPIEQTLSYFKIEWLGRRGLRLYSFSVASLAFSHHIFPITLFNKGISAASLGSLRTLLTVWKPSARLS